MAAVTDSVAASWIEQSFALQRGRCSMAAVTSDP